MARYFILYKLLTGNKAINGAEHGTPFRPFKLFTLASVNFTIVFVEYDSVKLNLYSNKSIIYE